MGKSNLEFLDEDPRLKVTESIKHKKELEACSRGELFIVGNLPKMVNINGHTETFEPLVELYTALRKNNRNLFNIDLVLSQNNDLVFYKNKETELITLRFEATNNLDQNEKELSERFATIFPAIKLIFIDLITIWSESPNGLPKYMEAFKRHSIPEAEKAIDNFLIEKGLKKPKTKKPAK